MALCKAQGTLPERDRKRELHWKPTFDPSLEEWQDHNWPPTSRVLTNQWSVTCHQGSGYKGPRRLSHSVNSKCRSSTYLRSPRRWTHTHTHMFDRQYQLQNLENVGVFFLKVYSTTGRRSSFITCQPAISSAQTTERCSWLPQTFLLCKFNDSPSIHCAEEKSYRHGFILNYIKLGLSNHPSASAGEK